MANNSFGREEEDPSDLSVEREEEDPSDLSVEREEQDLEAFLDSALENDPVLKRILEKGLTQVVKAAFRLLQLQRGRDKGSNSREKMPESKNVMGCGRGDPEALRVSGSPFVVEEGESSSSKDTDNNPPSATMNLGGSKEPWAEREVALWGHGGPQDNKYDHHGGPRLAGVERESEIEEAEGFGLPSSVELVKGPKSKRTPSKKRGKVKPCCPFCQKTFPTPSKLERHLTTHNQAWPFTCHFCGKGFFLWANLDRHIRRHFWERWFKCPYQGCSSSFVSGDELKQHSIVHSGERPFKCPHPGCTSSFTTGGELKMYSIVHSGEILHQGCIPKSGEVEGSKIYNIETMGMRGMGNGQPPEGNNY